MSATPTTAPLSSGGPMSQQGQSIPSEFYFITAPQDISWDKGSKTREVEAYGSNTPYLNYGTTKLRKLQLNNAMLEGFSDGKQVEANVLQLEACQLMVIAEEGYASPYVWKVFAGDKTYGNFVILDISVKETMRDLSGKATRAFADITLVEVPEAQVSSGADITATAVTGSISSQFQSDLVAQEQAVAAARNPARGAGAAGGAGGGANPANPASPTNPTAVQPSGSGRPNNGGPSALEQAAQEATGLTPAQQQELLNN